VSRRKDGYPSPRELVRAHRTLAQMHRSIPYGVRDIGGMPAWDGIVEGKRMLAVATCYLAEDDERYAKAWNTMVGGG